MATTSTTKNVTTETKHVLYVPDTYHEEPVRPGVSSLTDILIQWMLTCIVVCRWVNRHRRASCGNPKTLFPTVNCALVGVLCTRHSVHGIFADTGAVP